MVLYQKSYIWRNIIAKRIQMVLDSVSCTSQDATFPDVGSVCDENNKVAIEVKPTVMFLEDPR
jgi:hypothetical protein